MSVTTSPTPVPAVAAAYLLELGFPVPERLSDLPVAVRLALSLRAEFEAAYGADPGDAWEVAESVLYHAVPDRTVEGVQAYSAATHASLEDLADQGAEAIRRAAARIPAGCFCSIIAAPSACLTCTCPDCGATGRFGLPVVHRVGCA